MTTIVWDGKELVADSRITFFEETLRHVDNEICKIFVSKNFFYKGQPVLAVGVAGNATLLAGLTAVKELEHERLDFADAALYQNNEGFAAHKAVTLLLILQESIVMIAYHNEQHSVRELSRHYRAGIGTGAELLGQMTLLPLPARLVVGAASVLDLSTGGNFATWNEQKGLQNLLERPQWFRRLSLWTLRKLYRLAEQRTVHATPQVS